MFDMNIIDMFPINTTEILTSLVVSLICGIIISVVYKISYKGPNYSRNFVNSLIILSMITSIVLLVIGNNLARAFGLVGAMSIIRFRTAVRDVQDIIYIFFSLSVGMASGVGLYLVAFISTVFISIILLILSNANVFQTSEVSYLIQIIYKPDEDSVKLKDLLKKNSRSLKIVNLRTLEDIGYVEAYYNIKLRNNIDKELFVTSIRSISSVKEVNLFFDNDEMSIPSQF